MSLLGALNLGQNSLAIQQIGLQVTGNNISNAGTAGYARETVNITPNAPQTTGMGIALGSGASVTSIDRQVSAALDESLRDATSDDGHASTVDSFMSRIEAAFGTPGSNDLSARMQNFFNGFSTLANNPQDTSQRSIVVQNGVSLAGYMNTLRSQLTGIRDDAQAQVKQLATQANTLAQKVASLNGQIAVSESGGGAAGGLRDQRDQALSDLSQLMNTRTIEQSNGQVDVFVGSTALVQGTSTRGISTKQTIDPATKLPTTQVTLADSGDVLNIQSGSLGGLTTVRDTYMAEALGTLDTMAAALIYTVNSVHSQGQGLAGFSSVTGTTQDLAPTAPLNTSGLGLPNTPVNGTFNINLKDAATGQITTQQIKVNLTGVGGAGSQTSLNDLAAAITTAGGGKVTATVDASGRLSIQSTSASTTFTFSDDTSGALTALGINTFFSGQNAATISVNNTLVNNSDLLASGRDNNPGSNKNAQALALGYTAAGSTLGGTSLQTYYTNFSGTLATQASAASDNRQSQATIKSTLLAQQQSYSGVNMDEEAINLTKYQRAFQASARYISAVDQMMQTILAMAQ